DGRTNYLDKASDIEPPLLLLIGKKNLCWHDSIQQFHDLLDTYFEDVDHELLEVPNYGHMDLFLGKHAHLEVFPDLVDFLLRH
ncbi:MAG: hypothetical protein KDC44_22185, partial [Phaeodactylibacter sp.]|nr:hypothetical protein [Phaeodactylibacter sp.]